MSLHATFMAAAGIGGLLRAQGEAIEITPKNSQSVSMTALVGVETVRTAKDRQGERQVRSRTVTITKDPEGEFGGMEDPQENAVLTYAGTDYSVGERADGVGYWELTCDFVGRRERSKPGLRQG